MITGGESYEALKFGAFPYSDELDSDKLSFFEAGGFGFFPFGLVDTVCEKNNMLF